MIVMSTMRGTALALMSLLTFAGCQRSVGTIPADTASSSAHAGAANPNHLPSLGDAQNKLEDLITQPASPFRLTYLKTGSDGYSCSYDVEVSPKGIKGKETLVRSPSKPNPPFDARTQVRDLDGSPIGSNSWRFIANDLLSSLGDDLQYASPGLRYVADESSGGFDTSHYDIDLANIAIRNQSLPVNAGLVTAASSSQQPKYYSIKGSAWIAKDDGRLVKAQYDRITTFSDGTKAALHYDLAVTKE